MYPTEASLDLESAIHADEKEIDNTETPLNISNAVEIRRKVTGFVQKMLPGLRDSERMRVQTPPELVVRSRSVVFLQCCSAGVVVTVVSRALGRRSQARPAVCSSVLVSFLFVQFMGGADAKIEGAEACVYHKVPSSRTNLRLGYQLFCCVAELCRVVCRTTTVCCAVDNFTADAHTAPIVEHDKRAACPSHFRANEFYLHNAEICTQNGFKVLEVGYLRKPGLLIARAKKKAKSTCTACVARCPKL